MTASIPPDVEILLKKHVRDLTLPEARKLLAYRKGHDYLETTRFDTYSLAANLDYDSSGDASEDRKTSDIAATDASMTDAALKASVSGKEQLAWTKELLAETMTLMQDIQSQFAKEKQKRVSALDNDLHSLESSVRAKQRDSPAPRSRSTGQLLDSSAKQRETARQLAILSMSREPWQERGLSVAKGASHKHASRLEKCREFSCQTGHRDIVVQCKLLDEASVGHSEELHLEREQLALNSALDTLSSASAVGLAPPTKKGRTKPLELSEKTVVDDWDKMLLALSSDSVKAYPPPAARHSGAVDYDLSAMTDAQISVMLEKELCEAHASTKAAAEGRKVPSFSSTKSRKAKELSAEEKDEIVNARDFLPRFRQRAAWIERALGVSQKYDASVFGLDLAAISSAIRSGLRSFAHTDSRVSALPSAGGILGAMGGKKKQQPSEEPILKKQRSTAFLAWQLLKESTVAKENEDLLRFEASMNDFVLLSAVNGRGVNCLDTSPAVKDLFCVSHNEFDNGGLSHARRGAVHGFYTINPGSLAQLKGLTNVWNMHVKHKPEYVLKCESMTQKCGFHPSKPSLVYGVCQSGELIMFDLRVPPKHKDDSSGHSGADRRSHLYYSLPVAKSWFCSGHLAPVFDFAFLPTIDETKHHLMTVSNDGRFCMWNDDDIRRPHVSENLSELRTMLATATSEEAAAVAGLRSVKASATRHLLSSTMARLRTDIASVGSVHSKASSSALGAAAALGASATMDMTTTCLSFPPRNSSVLTFGCDDGSICNAELFKSGARKSTAKCSPTCSSSAVASAKAGGGRAVHLQPLRTPAHSGPITRVEYNPVFGAKRKVRAADGKRPLLGDVYLSASYDWTVKLWHRELMRPLANYCCFEDYVYDARWHPRHPNVFAACDGTATVYVCHLAKSLDQAAFKLTLPHAGSRSPLTAMRWNTDGKLLFVGNSDGRFNILKAHESIFNPKPVDYELFEFVVQKRIAHLTGDLQTHK